MILFSSFHKTMKRKKLYKVYFSYTISAMQVISAMIHNILKAKNVMVEGVCLTHV
jgi:hypothetical protein